MARLLDGRPVAAKIKTELQAAVGAITEAGGPPIGLAILEVGADLAATWYIRSIKRAAEGIGMRVEHRALPADAEQAAVVAEVQRLSSDPTISGIIIQMPLPRHIDALGVVEALDPRKDIDGLHPLNAGRLAQGLQTLIPNTPAGGMELLRYYNIPIAGQRAVVVGRSNVVGKPLALLLLQQHATVTICHSRTPDLAAAIREADLVAVAVGQPGLVTGAMLKPGATVLDFGINDQDGTIVGDVDWASAEPVAGAITPVPGGTGPVTNMMLLRNTLTAYNQMRNT